MKLKYYVYEWYDENNIVFYVGKGCDSRYQSLKSRNKKFKEYIKCHECHSRIIKRYENEDDAYKKEFELIKHYRSINQCFTNIDDGGKALPTFFGNKNSQFGVTPKERMDKETYQGWLEKHKKIVGDKNPNYGNHKLSEKYQNDKDYALEKQSRPRGMNGRAIKIILYNENKEYIKKFDCIQDCVDYLGKEKNISINITAIYTKFSKLKTKIIKYKNFYLEKI